VRKYKSLPIKFQPSTSQGGAKFNPWKDFVMSDCVNEYCIDGIVSILVDGYHTAYRCPECTRAGMSWLPPYPYEYPKRTPEEMAARLEERKQIYRDKEERRQRWIDVVARAKDVSF